VRGQRLPDLLSSLERQIGAAQHQQRRDRPRREHTERQGRRQQEKQLVAQRPDRDLGDDRQLAIGREADHVARRHRGIVDHHPGRLGTGLGGVSHHVVDRRRRDLGQGDNVVEQR
jgi:hypothetical protein